MVQWILSDILYPKRQFLVSKSNKLDRIKRSKAWFCFFVILLNVFVTKPTVTHGAAANNNNNHLTSHTVNTKYGTLRGLRLQFSSSSPKHLEPVSAYLGIPYASPPINAYRFMPPVAPLPWGQGTRLATTFPPACPQRFPDISNRTKALQSMTFQRYSLLEKLIPYLANQSEDCLYLNFYVPTVPPGEEIRPGRFAILFVIHGESWEWGSGNEFDGGILASLGNHITVTFNYRLGILGFMKTSNQQSNFGLLDVIAALHYVRENCDAFGGDRNRITLLGYRTGAVIANLLLIAQIAKDLFQRAILISGSVLSPWALQSRPEEIALQVSHQLGCKGRLPLNHPESDLAPCLRKKHLSDLLNFVPNSPRFLSPFAPYVDNILIKNPKIMMEGSGTPILGSDSQMHSSTSHNNYYYNEQFKKSQLLLIFSTSESANELNDEELRIGFESEHRDKILRTLVRNVFNYHQQEIFSIVRNEYTDWERPILHPIPLRDSTVEALSDCLVLSPMIQLALTHSKLLTKTTYLLHFSHVSRELEFSPYERLGSMEGNIVPYVMGLPVTNNVPAYGGQPFLSPWSTLFNFTKQDSEISEKLIHFLTNFIQKGDPNSNENSQLPGTSSIDWSTNNNNGRDSREKVRNRWEPYDSTNQLYMNIGAKPKIKNHYRSHKLALWLNLIPQIHVSGGVEVSISHHSFQEESPAYYIGSIRQMYPFSFADQIPGLGPDFMQNPTHQHHSTSTTPSGLPPAATTECLEPSESPSYSHGMMNPMDLGTGINVNGLGSTRESSSSSINSNNSPNGPGGVGEYDYTTALTVTLTVGVCLILLNLLVFSAIMCHRKRGLNGTLSLSTSDSPGTPGSRHGLSGTPLKNSYQNQDDFKWMNSSGSHHHHHHHGHHDENYTDAQLHSGIPMSQYVEDYCNNSSSSTSLMRRSSYAGGSGREGGPAESPTTTLLFLGSGGTGSMDEIHQLPPSAHYQYHPMKSDYCTIPRNFGGHKQHSNCLASTHHFHIPPPPLPTSTGHFQIDEQTCYSGGSSSAGSIRLYMNQSAGDDEVVEIIPENVPLPLPNNISLYSQLSNSNSLNRRSLLAKSSNNKNNPLQSPQPGSSTSGNGTSTTTSVSTPTTCCNNTGNPSPSTGSTTLVSALKRHSSSGTPNSTVKKRVQIQEISV